MKTAEEEKLRAEEEEKLKEIERKKEEKREQRKVFIIIRLLLLIVYATDVSDSANYWGEGCAYFFLNEMVGNNSKPIWGENVNLKMVN